MSEIFKMKESERLRVVNSMCLRNKAFRHFIFLYIIMFFNVQNLLLCNRILKYYNYLTDLKFEKS